MGLYGDKKDYETLFKENMDKAKILFQIAEENRPKAIELLKEKEQILEKNGFFANFKLRKIEKVVVKGKEQEVFREFYKPWETFTSDVQNSIENMIVSFKQNLRVINKTVNKYEHYDENGKKVIVKQNQPFIGEMPIGGSCFLF